MSKFQDARMYHQNVDFYNFQLEISQNHGEDNKNRFEHQQ